jgi:hypothetical protein
MKRNAQIVMFRSLSNKKRTLSLSEKKNRRLEHCLKQRLIVQNVVIGRLSTGWCKHEEQTSPPRSSSDAPVVVQPGERTPKTPFN